VLRLLDVFLAAQPECTDLCPDTLAQWCRTQEYLTTGVRRARMSGNGEWIVYECGADLWLSNKDPDNALSRISFLAMNAVAGAAKGEPLVLFIGLAVSIILMAVASNFIAKLLVKYPWIAWIGLLIIVWVAFEMIYAGSHEVACKAYNFGCSETLLEGIKHRLGIGGGT